MSTEPVALPICHRQYPEQKCQDLPHQLPTRAANEPNIAERSPKKEHPGERPSGCAWLATKGLITESRKRGSLQRKNRRWGRKASSFETSCEHPHGAQGLRKHHPATTPQLTRPFLDREPGDIRASFNTT
eukprot:216774-Amphidinium_carterae.1